MVKTFLIFILLCTSCAKLGIKSSKKFPITTSENINETREIRLEITKDFYMWGLLPSKHELLLDKELYKKGVKSLSSLEITQAPTQKDVWMKILSLGLFLPETYIITGKTK